MISLKHKRQIVTASHSVHQAAIACRNYIVNTAIVITICWIVVIILIISLIYRHHD